MRPARLARTSTLAVLLAALPGCSWVHQRQALVPGGGSRTAADRASARRAARDEAPKVNLRVDPATPADRAADDRP